jgi:glycosidase
MINIYQLFPRLFGNQESNVKPYGTIEENGCGKFESINDQALEALQELGITHIWLTGIIRHASLTDYSALGLPAAHPQTVKGVAGSPYAITDYYDVCPDLATDPEQRMSELEALIERIHQKGLGVLMDFVPNHVARGYASFARPEGIPDLGEGDCSSLAFSPENNFYYLPGQKLQLPALADQFGKPIEPYDEFPAKVTGNDCFSATPTINDWYDTVKLNYGKDFQNGEQVTQPIPDTWLRMQEILSFWSAKGVDGFRVDMAGMVPLAFWEWLIPPLKQDYKELIMIAEIYEPELYQGFVNAGFDFLYDKIGIYNRLEAILRHGQAAESISICWKMLQGLDDKMLRFMENHDEIRLASPHFLTDPFAALPAVSLSALMHRGPFMLYNGQESGERAEGVMGYSGDDGRTSIFDYTHMPQHQQWFNGGRCDGGKLSEEQVFLRRFYQNILRLRLSSKAFSKGRFYDLMWANPWYTNFDPRFVYAFLRYFEDERYLVLVNFNRHESRNMCVNIPDDAREMVGIFPGKTRRCWIAENIFEDSDKLTFDPDRIAKDGIWVHLEPLQTIIYKLQPIPKSYDNPNYENC